MLLLQTFSSYRLPALALNLHTRAGHGEPLSGPFPPPSRHIPAHASRHIHPWPFRPVTLRSARLNVPAGTPWSILPLLAAHALALRSTSLSAVA